MPNRRRTLIDPFQLREGDVFTVATSEFLYGHYRKTCQRLKGKHGRKREYNCPAYDDDLVSKLRWGETYFVLQRHQTRRIHGDFPEVPLVCVRIKRNGKPGKHRFTFNAFNLHRWGSFLSDYVRVRVLRRMRQVWLPEESNA